MPKFLLGRITFYVTQVEAENAEKAIQLNNANNRAKTECPAVDNIAGVGETHRYAKAWVEDEETPLQERVALLTKEIAELLSVIDRDGSRKALIHLPFTNGTKTNPVDRPLGS